MAGDTRESANKKAEAYATPVAPENANALPGGGLNTAGAKVKEATFIDGLKSIRLSDLKEIHKKPCVRDSLMMGIGTGFAFGALRTVLGGKQLSSTSNPTVLIFYSAHIRGLQLGCWIFCVRVILHARVLPAEADLGDAGNEESRGGHREKEDGEADTSSRG